MPFVTKRAGLTLVSLGLIATMAGLFVGGVASAAAATQALTQVTLATLPVADTAVAVVAQQKGIFKQNGLSVKLDVVQLGPATTQAVVSGAAQFSQSNYASLYTARSHGLPIEIVCEAANSLSAFSTVAVLKNSPITSPKDLAGKRIATAVIGGIGPLAIDVWLKAHGVNYKSITWVQMPFPQMGAALQEHQVAAAWLVEPFVTIDSHSLHTRTVFEVFSGPTAGLPVSAFATSSAYANSHPKIVAAFKKSISEAATLIAKDPSLVRKALPTYTKIQGKLATQIGLESYPSVTSLTAIERVATMMKEVGFLTSPLNVAAMLFGAK